MNESELRAELRHLATSSPPGPARLDLDEMLRRGRRRIRRRRAGALPASVAAVALVVLSFVGIARLTSGQFSGLSSSGAPAAELPEAGGSTNPAAAQWAVPAYYSVPPRGIRFMVPAASTRSAWQATLVSGHVAF